MGVNWSKSYNLLVDSWIYYQGTKRPYSSSRPYHPCSPGQTILYKFSYQKMRWCDYDCSCLCIILTLYPSQRHLAGMHKALWHRNWPEWQGGKSGGYLFCLAICFRFRFWFVFVSDLCYFFLILNVLVILASSRIIKKMYFKSWTWSCTKTNCILKSCIFWTPNRRRHPCLQQDH